MKSKGNLFGVNYLMQNNKLCPIQIVSYLDLLFITDFLKSLDKDTGQIIPSNATVRNWRPLSKVHIV